MPREQATKPSVVPPGWPLEVRAVNMPTWSIVGGALVLVAMAAFSAIQCWQLSQVLYLTKHNADMLKQIAEDN